MSERTWVVHDSVDDLDESRYCNLLEHSDTASIYHHPGWLGALEKGLKKEPRHILVKDNGNPVGALPNFLDPLDPTPFSRFVSVNPGRGGPVLTSSWEPVLDVLFEGVDHLLTTRVVEHEIRTDIPDHLSLTSYLEEAGYDVTVSGKFVLRLNEDWDNILAGMDKDRRYDIRKAIETDHDVRELEFTESNLSDFYADYCQKMEELGTRTLPRTFFNELVDGLEDKLILVTNVADGKRRGYHLYLMDDYQSTIRHYLMTVTQDDYEYFSGELIHRYMIRRGLQEGWDRYDFGGRDVDFRDGGFKYKQRFGGDLIPSFRWRRTNLKTVQYCRNLARLIR